MKQVIYFFSLVFLLFIFLLPDCAFPQDIKLRLAGDSTDVDEYDMRMTPYGKLWLALNGTDKQVGVTDNGSRLGLNLNQKVSKGISVFGTVELGVRLSEGGSVVNLSPDGNFGSGYINVSTSNDYNVFKVRRGFVGVDFAEYGSIAIGKQYASYYMIAGETDISEMVSGYTAFTSTPTGTDGGQTGTGKASNSVYYHNRIGSFEVSATTQFFINDPEYKRVLDCVGGSSYFYLTDEFKIGAGIQQLILSRKTFDKVRGLGGNPWYGVAGAELYLKNFYAGVNVARMEYGDLIDYNDSTVMYSGWSLEFAAKYTLGKWNFLGGVNLMKPDVKFDYINDDFRTVIGFLGVNYAVTKNFLLFMESKLDFSYDAFGKQPPSALIGGVRGMF
jgi:predicted porin